MQDPNKTLKELGLTDSEIKVYLTMSQGITTARDIIKVTRLKRPTVYYALNALEKRALISKTGREGTKRFTIEPYSRLVTIAKNQAQANLDLVGELESLIPIFGSTNGQSEKPNATFFEGDEAIKNLIMETLYCKEQKIDVIAPNDNFFWQTGKKFVEQYVIERKKRQIVTRSLWETAVESKTIDEYYLKSQVRILPKVMKGKFKTTIILYDDKVLFISSAKNSYCLLFTSTELNQTMKTIFEGLWQFSK